MARKATRNSPDTIRDRVRELRRVRASTLLPDPRNWRRHPAHQQAALAGVLREVGYADALLAREDVDGRLILIDGHLRAGTTPDQEVPVLILDVDEREAGLLLATLDPLAALADTDGAALVALASAAGVQDAQVAQFLDDLAQPWRDAAALGGAAGVAGEGAERTTGPVVTMVLPCADLAVVERALFQTGCHTRGEALVALARAWLEAHGHAA